MLWVPPSDLNEEEAAMEKGMQMQIPQGSKQLSMFQWLEKIKGSSSWDLMEREG